jgi:hypothetical protein
MALFCIAFSSSLNLALILANYFQMRRPAKFGEIPAVHQFFSNEQIFGWLRDCDSH